MASSLKSQRIVESNSLNISESKDHQFQFFEKKTQNQTTINSSYVKNLKEPKVFRKESHGSLAGSLTFFSMNNIYRTKTSSSNFGRTDK
jgi:hypothetical protein